MAHPLINTIKTPSNDCFHPVNECIELCLEVTDFYDQQETLGSFNLIVDITHVGNAPTTILIAGQEFTIGTNLANNEIDWDSATTPQELAKEIFRAMNANCTLVDCYDMSITQALAAYVIQAVQLEAKPLDLTDFDDPLILTTTVNSSQIQSETYEYYALSLKFYSKNPKKKLGKTPKFPIYEDKVEIDLGVFLACSVECFCNFELDIPQTSEAALEVCYALTDHKPDSPCGLLDGYTDISEPFWITAGKYLKGDDWVSYCDSFGVWMDGLPENDVLCANIPMVRTVMLPEKTTGFVIYAAFILGVEQFLVIPYEDLKFIDVPIGLPQVAELYGVPADDISSWGVRVFDTSTLIAPLLSYTSEPCCPKDIWFAFCNKHGFGQYLKANSLESVNLGFSGTKVCFSEFCKNVTRTTNKKITKTYTVAIEGNYLSENLIEFFSSEVVKVWVDDQWCDINFVDGEITVFQRGNNDFLTFNYILEL